MNFKEIIGSGIVLPEVNCDLSSMVTEMVDKTKGDYTFCCFSLAKTLKKSPIEIANSIKENYPTNGIVNKIEVVNGYVNFFLDKEYCNKTILSEINANKCFEPIKEYADQTVCLDYSSVNLAKYMHIGHLSTTMIGESLARIHKALGFNVVRINYIGDYGTPFGKMLYAHLTWGNDKDLDARGVDYLQDIYVEFCKRAEEDESLEEKAREYFKKICDKDEKVYPIFQKFIDISKKEANRILNMLGVQFDSWKGESAYSDELDNVVNMLKAKNLLQESQGAQVVDLENYNLGTCLIQKSDGTSLYATRDIAAAIDRFNTYHFNKMIYVTAVQQKLHFQQFFKVIELLGYDFSKDLQHVYYGMFSLPNGKIASRKGKQAVLVDLMDYSYNKALDIIKDRNYDETKKQEIANKIAFSALKFSTLKNERIKDTVFDIENAFSFEGDTSAYIQYTYARICSIIKKANIKDDFKNINYDALNSDIVYNILMFANNYQNIVLKAMQNSEPSIVSKYLLDMCKMINKFYTTEKVITENLEATKAKIYLLKNIKKILTNLFNLVCIDTVEEM